MSKRLHIRLPVCALIACCAVCVLVLSWRGRSADRDLKNGETFPIAYELFTCYAETSEDYEETSERNTKPHGNHDEDYSASCLKSANEKQADPHLASEPPAAAGCNGY